MYSKLGHIQGLMLKERYEIFFEFFTMIELNPWKNIFITGGSLGLGKSLAKKLISMNAKSVIILARNKEKLEETVKELKVRFFPLWKIIYKNQSLYVLIKIKKLVLFNVMLLIINRSRTRLKNLNLLQGIILNMYFVVLVIFSLFQIYLILLVTKDHQNQVIFLIKIIQ